MATNSLYEHDEELQYQLDGKQVTVQTRASMASTLVFDHTFNTDADAITAFWHVMAGRAQGKAIEEIVAKILSS